MDGGGGGGGGIAVQVTGVDGGGGGGGGIAVQVTGTRTFSRQILQPTVSSRTVLWFTHWQGDQLLL